MSTPSPEGARDRAWLEALYVSHRAQVLAYSVRRVGPDAAEDVVSEVFAAAWRHRAKVPVPPLPWLYRTASNHVFHVWRGAGRRARLSDRVAALAEVEAVVVDPAERLVSTDQALRLMERLSPRDAEVLRLAAWEQLDIPEIAYVLGCTPSAARVRLHRARRRAEQLLAAAGTDTDGAVAPAPNRPAFVTLAEEPS